MWMSAPHAIQSEFRQRVEITEFSRKQKKNLHSDKVEHLQHFNLKEQDSMVTGILQTCNLQVYCLQFWLLSVFAQVKQCLSELL